MKVIIIYNFVKYIYNMTASDHGVPPVSEYGVPLAELINQSAIFTYTAPSLYT